MLFSHVREDGLATFFYPYSPYHDRASVHVTGSFNGWQTPGHALHRVEYGWLCDLGPLPMGDTAYKFVVDGQWMHDPINLVRRGDNSLLQRGGHQGLVLHLQFYSPALNELRGYALYLPPGHSSPTLRFPTLYLLHGMLDWELTWLEKGGLAFTMDGLRAEGAVGDMAVVMPKDHGGLYEGDERCLDYLARDIVGHIDHEFQTFGDSRHRAVDGLSTGGFTSTVLSAVRHEVFRSVGSMSGSHDERTFATIREYAGAMRWAGQRHLVSCGSSEPHVETSRSVARVLDGAGISTKYAEGQGDHEWPTWRGALVGHLRFHWENIRP